MATSPAAQTDTYAVSLADLEARTGLVFPGLVGVAGARDALTAPEPVIVTSARDVRW